jgi:hypothetical protein
MRALQCRGLRELRRGRHPSKQQRIPARTDQSSGLVDPTDELAKTMEVKTKNEQA